MASYENTTIWQHTLATQLGHDPDAAHRERLRNAFERFHDRAKTLAGEIARSLPEFTVHDITHIDALWDMANIIVDEQYPLTPAEGFVLGGAFLIHDLGLGLAAYPDGIDELRNNKVWKDTVVAKLRQRLGHTPTAEEISHPDQETETEVTRSVLRELHAKHAERLALVAWKDEHTATDFYLIDDVDLRTAYGSIIGRIAHSHWWSVDQLRERFTAPSLGAPGEFPNDWAVDPTKLACILRAADACHLDDRRAPAFLRALRKPHADGEKHWIFQEQLYQPRLEDDRLVYTSKSAFSVDDVEAWWLCYDTLRMVDRELRQVDSLLADTRRPRLAARGVSSVEEPKRLVKLVGTTGWEPVDAQIKVGDVARLVSNLGGEALYGKDVLVPLRELIQNASDAVRARRTYEDRQEDWGNIFVRHGVENDQHWIEVEDTGIGMSPGVLTGPFLDFGTSFWGSDLMHTELPGLEAKGFTSTGKYGIGFFSVFMWGDRVQVFSRRPDKAREDTWVLEFTKGLLSRPILRRAHEHERSRDGGTRVRVWLKSEKTYTDLISSEHEDKRRWTLSARLGWLCPALDVNLQAADKGKEQEVISASDWKTMDGVELLKRVQGPIARKLLKKQLPSLPMLSNNLRFVTHPSGEVLGRAAVTWNDFGLLNQIEDDEIFEYVARGVVTIGGFRSSELTGVVGILIGESYTAARHIGIPKAESSVLSSWCTEQADILHHLSDDHERLNDAAAVVRAFGASTSQLPIARSSIGWLSFQDIANMQLPYDEIRIVFSSSLSLTEREVGPITLEPNAFVTELGVPGILQTGRYETYPHIMWPKLGSDFDRKSLYGATLEAIALAWGVTVTDLEKVSPGLKKSVKAEVGTANGERVVIDFVYIVRKPEPKPKRTKK